MTFAVAHLLSLRRAIGLRTNGHGPYAMDLCPGRLDQGFRTSGVGSGTLALGTRRSGLGVMAVALGRGIFAC